MFKALIIISCLLIGLFFSLRLGLFSYSSRSFNCSKPENSCRIVGRHLLFDKDDILSINISEIKKVVAEDDSVGKGSHSYALNIYTDNKKYTYLESGSYYRKNLYDCSRIIANFLASKKNNLNLVYKFSAFKSIMGIVISLLIIMGIVLGCVFQFDNNKYFSIVHFNNINGKGFLNLLPVSLTMLMLSILLTFIISQSLLEYERQIGLAVGFIYIIIYALISVLGVYHTFLPEKLYDFLKKDQILTLCKVLVYSLIILLLLIILVYGFGVVSLYMC